MRRSMLVLIASLALMSCGKASNMEAGTTESLSTMDVSPPQIVAVPSGEPQQADTQSSRGPQIAYTYQVTYTLADDAIAAAQARATALCAKLGRTRCIVVKTNLSRNDEGSDGSVKLVVAADLAPRFNRDLDGISTQAGGETSARTVEAEDLTKQLIDTAARIRAKQALADRLLALLRNADGKVADLVAAERAYADVQEELDAARTLNAELSRRVAMSAIDISYRSARTTATWAPLSRAGSEVADNFASSVASLLTFVVAVTPWVLLLALITWITRRIGWRPRWPLRRRPPP